MDKEQIIRIIVEELRKLGYSIKKDNGVTMQRQFKTGFFTEKKYIESYSSLPKGKKLITEYDVKQMLKQNPGLKEITISKDSILGPLAEDFLASRGIKVIKEK